MYRDERNIFAGKRCRRSSRLGDDNVLESQRRYVFSAIDRNAGFFLFVRSCVSWTSVRRGRVKTPSWKRFRGFSWKRRSVHYVVSGNGYGSGHRTQNNSVSRGVRDRGKKNRPTERPGNCFVDGNFAGSQVRRNFEIEQGQPIPYDNNIIQIFRSNAIVYDRYKRAE